MCVDGMVLVHGGMCTSSCWDSVVSAFRTPVIAVDLPGRAGHPAALDTVTLDKCVQAVINAADEAGFGRFALTSHSLGGVTATETAWRYPDRVAQLIYVGALVPEPGVGGAMTQSGAEWPAGQPVTIEESIGRALFGNDMSDDQWAACFAGFVPDSEQLINAPVSGYPADTPTTYIALADDVAVPPALVEEMLANLNVKVDRRILKGGHMVMLTRPGALAAMLNDVAG
jgi:pimeloyl-ACP methyl ester carboxylesterase